MGPPRQHVQVSIIVHTSVREQHHSPPPPPRFTHKSTWPLRSEPEP